MKLKFRNLTNGLSQWFLKFWKNIKNGLGLFQSLIARDQYFETILSKFMHNKLSDLNSL